ncbi:MAG: DUF4279 domain-containing protein [Thermoleophilia bacterium]
MNYDDSYETCAETYATLCIYHEDLDPEEINLILGLESSWSCRKGDPVSKKEPDRSQHRQGAWLLSTEGRIDSKDSRRHIVWLLGQVENKSEILTDLQNNSYEMRISCFWVSKHGHGGPIVSTEECERLSRLGIELYFDFYSGDDEPSY